jgi:glycosyltransferase involved in cell wall biosynthesis
MSRTPQQDVSPDRNRDQQVPLVSVILVTNRASAFLREALDSVARQTYPNVELIVVDDGAEDPQFIEVAVSEHSTGRVVHQTSAGVSAARNAGAAEAKGELLVFLDDDDRWRPERLALQSVALLDAPDAVVSYCGMQSIDDAGAVIAPADQFAVKGEVDIARRATGIILPNVIVRRTAFEQVGGFEPQLRLAEDLDLILSLARLGDFVFVPDVLVDYRSHSANTTKRYRDLCKGIDGVIRAHLSAAEVRGDSALVAAFRESLLANQRYAWWSALRAAKADLSQGHAGRAVGAVAWSLRFAPRGVRSALLRRLRRGN